MITKTALYLLEKNAQVTGPSPKDLTSSINHLSNDADKRRSVLNAYIQKSEQPNTSWSKALLTGGGIGGLTGSALGLSHGPGLSALLGLGGAAAGAGIGAILKSEDDAEIEYAKNRAALLKRDRHSLAQEVANHSKYHSTRDERDNTSYANRDLIDRQEARDRRLMYLQHNLNNSPARAPYNTGYNPYRY